MAKNLQAKLPASDTLRIYDVNHDSLSRFVQEVGATAAGSKVEIAANVKEAADGTVSHLSKQSILHVLSRSVLFSPST